MARYQTDFDVIVVGAGPSGAAAAYRLVQCGYKVLMLDQHPFPRAKPCGGGITIKALNLLPYSVGPVIERATKKLGRGLMSSGTRRFDIFETDGHVCVFSVRKSFDHFNFTKTIEAGAEFEKSGPLSELEECESHVRIVHGGCALTSRYLIGADGANSAVRRLTKPRDSFYRGFAIEAVVDYAAVGSEPLPEFFFGYVPHGYGWLFPKGDHVSVGIYTYDRATALSKAQLRTYAADRLGTDKLDQIVGFPIGFGGQTYEPSSARVILVGDAAGLAEPLLGEGIHNAIKSGQAAASAIISADNGNSANLCAAYTRALRPIRKDIARCDNLKKLLYSNIEKITSGSLRFPIGATAFMRGFAAGKTVYELTNAFLLLPFLRPIRPAGLRDFLEGNRW